MSNFYNNPEIALKRAIDFLELGKENDAVEYMHDILKNKKNRLMKNVYEAVIHKFLEVCVDFKMVSIVKGGLYLYRNLCFGTDVKSWEDAVTKFYDLAEQKIEVTAEDLHIADSKNIISYLDEIVTPESLLSSVSDCNNDMENKWFILFSRIQFTWDCYRICLDLLRNTQVEKFYHLVAQKAMNFCLKYQRKSEFHKLCHLLRIHFGNFKQKSPALTSLDNYDTLMLYLETETLELEIAFELELWQEVYKAIENLHFLIGIVKRHGNSRIIASYYKKLSEIFLKTGDSIFHAAAIFRYFNLTRDMKKTLNASDITVWSSTVVLAVLAIPYPPNDPKIDLLTDNDLYSVNKKHRLMSEILNFPGKLCRKSLVKDLENFGVIKLAQENIQELFSLLETEFDPLKMGIHILSIVKELSASSSFNKNSLDLYLKGIFDVFMARLLSQLSEIYDTITWKKFTSLVPMFDEFHIEILVAEAARKYDIPVRLDHRNSCLRFDKVQCIQNSKDELEVHYFTKVTNLMSLSQVYTSLKQIGRHLDLDNFEKQDNCARKTAYEDCLNVLAKDRIDISKRKLIIEKHKEMVEIKRVKSEESKRQILAAKQLEFEAAEKERLLKEAEKRAQQKLVSKEAEVKKKILQEKLKVLKQSEFRETFEKLDINELEGLDPELVISKHLEQIILEKKGFASRLQKRERITNHMERAKRIEEVPMLMQKYEEEKSTSKVMWEKNENRRIELILEKRAHNVKEKKRLIFMKSDLNCFIAKILERKNIEYMDKCYNFQKAIEQEREKRLKERADNRKMQRKLEWIKEQEEAKKIRSLKKEIKYTKYEISPKALRKAVWRLQTKGSYGNESPTKEKYSKSAPETRMKYESQIKNPRPKYQEIIQSLENPCNVRADKYESELKHSYPTKILSKTSYFSRNDTSNIESLDFEPDKKYKVKNRESSGMLDLSYNPSKRTYFPSNSTNREEFERSGDLNSNNHVKSEAKNTSNKEYFDRKAFSLQPLDKKSRMEFEPFYKLKFINDNSNHKGSTATNKPLKYVSSHSCTPWSKLKRENN